MGSSEINLQGFDRRERHRARYFARVEIESGALRFEARTADLSLDGMSLVVTEPLAAGAEFNARLFLEDDGPLEVGCVVKRVHSDGSIGAEFVDLKPACIERLRRLIESLPH